MNTSTQLSRRSFNPDTIAGLVTLCIGATFTIGGYHYGLGELTRIGAGFYPFMFGLIYTCMGAVIFLASFWAARNCPVIGDLHLRALLFTSLAVGSFIASIEILGLFPAAFFTSMLASCASRNVNIKASFIFSLTMAMVVSALFIYGLNTSVPFIKGLF